MTISSSIRTLVVDDSIVYRGQVKASLSLIDRVEVVGTCANGKIAIEKLLEGDVDLMILDLEMPIMDGLETLKKIEELNLQVKVIVFSSVSKKGAQITVEALNAGACDFATKPDHSTSQEIKEKGPTQVIKDLLESKILSLYPKEIVHKVVQDHVDQKKFPTVHIDLFKPQIIVIASSTGGPRALEEVFKGLGPNLCPIVIVQHMPPVFTETFAERLNKISQVSVSEAKEGDVLKPGAAYIAPGDYHVTLKRVGTEVLISLNQEEQINFVRPAADPLFASAAALYQDKCLGVVLTGMGSDGAAGAVAVKEEQGVVVIQNKETCTVFGMPGAVAKKGAFDEMMPLAAITSFLKDKGT